MRMVGPVFERKYNQIHFSTLLSFGLGAKSTEIPGADVNSRAASEIIDTLLMLYIGQAGLECGDIKKHLSGHAGFGSV